MENLMSKYDERKIMIEEKIGVAFALIAGVFLCIASVIMFVNMATRTAADINIKIVYEVAQLCGAGVASFAIPYATIKGAHTDMDIITSHLKPRVKAALEGVAGIVTIIVMVFTVFMLMDYAYQRTLTMETTTTNHLPIWIFRWTYAFGMLCTLLVAALEMVDSFRIAMGKNVVRRKEDLEEEDNAAAEAIAEAFAAEEDPAQLEETTEQKTSSHEGGGEA